MRRKTVFIGAFYILGLFIASFLSVSASCILMLLSVMASFALSLRFSPRYCLSAGIAFVFAIGLYLVYTVSHYNAIVAYDGLEIEFTGKVREVSYIGSDMQSFTLRGQLGGVTTDISFYAKGLEADYDDTVTVVATLTKVSDSLSYQSEKYSKPKGEFLSGGLAQVLSVKSGGFSLRREIMHYRDYLFDVVTDTLPEKEGGFIAAILCGDKSELSRDVRSSLYRVGIGHIFSVSGMHLIIITFAAMELLKRIKADYRLKFIIGEAVMAAFVVFAGASISVVRAAIMMTVLNSSVIMRRKYDCFSSIVISVIIMTLGQPYAIRSASLLLSAGGAFALGVAAPAAVKVLQPNGHFSSLKKSFIYMMSASVVLLPINLIFFDEISIIAPITNVLLVPLFTFSLVLAATVMFTGGIAFIATPMLMLAALPIKLLLFVSEKLARLPFSAVATGYKSVRITALICWSAAFAFALIAGKKNRAAIALVAVSFVCFIAACVTNYVMLSNTLRIYSLADGNSQMLVIGQRGSCVIVNISGSGKQLSAAAKRICDSKGFMDVKAFYDIADSTTAFVNTASRIDLSDSVINESFSGYADIEYFSGSIKLNGRYSIDAEGIYDTENSSLLSFDSEAMAVYITHEGDLSIRRLDYALIE